MLKLEAIPNPPATYKFEIGHRMRVSDIRELLAEVDRNTENLEGFLVVNSGHGKYTLRRPY